MMLSERLATRDAGVGRGGFCARRIYACRSDQKEASFVTRSPRSGAGIAVMHAGDGGLFGVPIESAATNCTDLAPQIKL